MLSFRSVILAAAAALLGRAAQADYNIEPKSVPLGTRQAWCSNEKQTCPLICQQVEPRTTLINTCDPEQLTYGCLCGNNQKPNISEYTLTLPYFICQEWGNQCVANCGGNNMCASDCREKNLCGATDPKKYNKTSKSVNKDGSDASPTEDANTVYTDGPGGSKSSGDSRGAGATLQLGRTYGLAVVLASLFAGFALL